MAKDVLTLAGRVSTARETLCSIIGLRGGITGEVDMKMNRFSICL
jgi:hypothetical protein